MSSRTGWRYANLDEAVLPLDKIVDHVHRAGTVKRVQRNQVLEAFRLQPPQYSFHAARFKLEYSVGLRLGKQGVDLRVVQGNIGEIEIDPFFLPDTLHRVVQHRERGQRRGSPS